VIQWTAVLLCFQDVTYSYLDSETGYCNWHYAGLIPRNYLTVIPKQAKTDSSHMLSSSLNTNQANVRHNTLYATDSFNK
jgi:hypothetical protein